MGDNLICVGTEDGHILIFNIPPKSTNINHLDTLKGAYSSSICDLASEKNILVSSDDQGNIVVWKFLGQQFQQSHKIAGSGVPCTSVRLWKGIIVGGYGSGHIRVYSASSGKIGAEVTAHARMINGIDIATQSGLVLSVSDDSFFRVWQLQEGNLPQISYKCHEMVTDLQLVGGCFVDPQGCAICLTGYDNSEIQFYIKS
ncbi:WD repeat-containing protein 54 [Patella vulgata]|uniref:WD repeat-containing protein 54 n=1 Tax=Patella vulgata TaxID=6465 RepID=UPI00217F23C6|nr:WD repeat-containing protein 54 [Patella vulgata]